MTVFRKLYDLDRAVLDLHGKVKLLSQRPRLSAAGRAARSHQQSVPARGLGLCGGRRQAISQAEREVGLPIAEGCAESFVADGVQYHLVSFPSEDGVARVKILAEMNIPHWPTPEMIRQIFAFFSHFRRDPETKESIYVE